MKFLVSGLICMETTVAVETFPIDYAPVRYPFFGIRSAPAGVGLNIAKALSTLGGEVQLLTAIGNDIMAQGIRDQLEMLPLSVEYLSLSETPQSVVAYTPNGQRAIFTDLKEVQERMLPDEMSQKGIEWCDIALLTNVNWNRPLLSLAKAQGKLIATDVHAIRELHDPYNSEFMRGADILFQSHEYLPCSPEEWAKRVQAEYGTAIIVIGMGAAGALLAVRENELIIRVQAVTPRPIINTIGAGDALFSAFIYSYANHHDPLLALKQAVFFAGYKIGAIGASEGFLTSSALERLLK